MFWSNERRSFAKGRSHGPVRRTHGPVRRTRFTDTDTLYNPVVERLTGVGDRTGVDEKSSGKVNGVGRCVLNSKVPPVPVPFPTLIGFDTDGETQSTLLCTSGPLTSPGRGRVQKSGQDTLKQKT